MVCGTPSSRTWKSFLVRSLGERPEASRTLNVTLTRWTFTLMCGGSWARDTNTNSSGINRYPDTRLPSLINTHEKRHRMQDLYRSARGIGLQPCAFDLREKEADVASAAVQGDRPTSRTGSG